MAGISEPAVKPITKLNSIDDAKLAPLIDPAAYNCIAALTIKPSTRFKTMFMNITKPCGPFMGVPSL